MPDVVDTWDVRSAPTSSTSKRALGLRLRRTPGLRSGNMGGEAAFAELYHRHHQELYRYCLSILRHEQDAQDALQNTMVKAHGALATEERDFELRPWLFRVAHNECINLVRKRRETTELVEELPAPATTEERHAEREALRQLEVDLSGLPERQRSALVLRELSGLSHDEIAEVLGVSSAVVKSTIFEARSALLQYREGRDMSCSTVRAALSDGDKRVLRGRRQRAHLSDCAGCRAFRAGLLARPGQLAALAPPLPAAAAAAMLHQLLSGSAVAGSAAAGSAAAGSAAAGSAAAGSAAAGSAATGSAAAGSAAAGSAAAVGTAGLGGVAASAAGSAVLGGVTAKLAAGAAVAALAAGGTAVVQSDPPSARTVSQGQDARPAAPRPATPSSALPGAAAPSGALPLGGPTTAAELARRNPAGAKEASRSSSNSAGKTRAPAGSRDKAGDGGSSSLNRRDTAARAAERRGSAKKLTKGRRSEAEPSVTGGSRRTDKARGGAAPRKAAPASSRRDRAKQKAPSPSPPAATTESAPTPTPSPSTRPPKEKETPDVSSDAPDADPALTP